MRAHHQFTQRHVATVVRLVIRKTVCFVFTMKAAAALGVRQGRRQFVEKTGILCVEKVRVEEKSGVFYLQMGEAKTEEVLNGTTSNKLMRNLANLSIKHNNITCQ